MQAIEALGRPVRDVTHFVLASCTGFVAPGLDQILAQRLGLRPDLQRTLIGFMGCCAAVPALRAAQAIVLADPAARVLVVNVELCTLHLQETTDLETALSFLVFGDGAAAALVTAEPEGLRLDDFVSVAIPETSGHITWHIGDQGFLCISQARCRVRFPMLCASRRIPCCGKTRCGTSIYGPCRRRAHGAGCGAGGPGPAGAGRWCRRARCSPRTATCRRPR